MRKIFFSFFLLTAIGFSASASHAQTYECLTRQEVRAAVASGKAVRLTSITRKLKSEKRGELIRAELCTAPATEDPSLKYHLTVISRLGRISRIVVEARTGTLPPLPTSPAVMRR